MKTENAFISEASIRFPDDNTSRPLVVFLELDYGGTFQGFSFSTDRLSNFMKAFDVRRFEDVKRTPVRVVREDRLPVALMHFTKERRFDP